MAITFTLKGVLDDATVGTSNATSYATDAAYTPTANTPCVAFVTATATVAAAPTFTGNGLTWTLRKAESWGTSDANRIYAFDSPGAASPTNTTGVFDCTGDAATGCAIMVVEIGGAHASTPFAQRVSTSNPTPGTGVTPSVTFSATAATSGILVAMCNLTNPAGSAVTGYTELSDIGFASPTTGMESTAHASPGSITSVSWTATYLNWGTIGYEIAIAAVNVDITTTTVAQAATIPSPTSAATAAITPTTVAAAVTIPTPAVDAGGASPDADVTPTTVTVIVANPAPSVVGNANAPPSTVAAIAAVPTPGVVATAAITTTTVAAVAAVPTPGVVGTAAITPTTVGAVASIPTPGVVGTAAITPITVAALTSIPVPSVSAGGSVSLTTTTVAALATVPTPSVEVTAAVAGSFMLIKAVG
jgi:hypothetical protein